MKQYYYLLFIALTLTICGCSLDGVTTAVDSFLVVDTLVPIERIYKKAKTENEIKAKNNNRESFAVEIEISVVNELEEPIENAKLYISTSPSGEHTDFSKPFESGRTHAFLHTQKEVDIPHYFPNSQSDQNGKFILKSYAYENYGIHTTNGWEWNDINNCLDFSFTITANNYNSEKFTCENVCPKEYIKSKVKLKISSNKLINRTENTSVQN